ncbi:hypothetical protein MtrunA17_Chr2g0304961 [Medicago truncatula]|uniref:Transmembrane protein n=1 Tax=Medicago truncatula TaxID=3880 RepID=A0A396J9K6_MEDTR|nr:hypothetical protein MtrunA17_Chr2g0304961 [Medicago truncatula]
MSSRLPMFFVVLYVVRRRKGIICFFDVIIMVGYGLCYQIG